MKRKLAFTLCLILLCLALLIPLVHAAVVIWEHEDSLENPGQIICGISVYAQTFTVGVQAHTVQYINLSMYKIGFPLDNVTVAIRRTNILGEPAGPDLASGNISSAILLTTPGQWERINLTTPYVLQAYAQYAIVAYDFGDTFSTYTCPIWSTGHDVMSGGNRWLSVTSGTTWIAAAGLQSQPFAVYGEAVNVTGNYTFYGLLNEHTGVYSGPVEVSAYYNVSYTDTFIVNHVFYYNSSGSIPEYFVYDLDSNPDRYYYLTNGRSGLETNATLYIYNYTTSLQIVNVTATGSVTNYDYGVLSRVVAGVHRTIEKLPIDSMLFTVEPYASYAVMLIDTVNYTFYNVHMTGSTVFLTIGSEGEPLIVNTFYISPVLLFFGKVGDILACFGVIGLMASQIRTMKDGLRGFIVSLLLMIVFFVIWFVITNLEAYA